MTDLWRGFAAPAKTWKVWGEEREGEEERGGGGEKREGEKGERGRAEIDKKNIHQAAK